MTSKQRGARALKAVKAYPVYEKHDLRSSIVDLVSDLLILAHHKSKQKKYQAVPPDTINFMEPEKIVNTAMNHFLTETAPGFTE